MENNDAIKKQRFKEMDQTGRLVKQEIVKLQELLRQMRVFEDGDEWENYCLNYLRSKLGKKPLRAYFARKTYEYLSEYPECKAVFQLYPDADTLFLQKLPFIFELIITIQYLHNHILDEKYDVKNNNHPMVVRNLISGNILRELLFLYLEQELPRHFMDRSHVERLVQAVRRLFLRVDIGQYLDKEYNHYRRWKGEVPPFVDKPPFFDAIAHQAVDEVMNTVKADVPRKTAFIEAYFQRIYLSNVYFFRCMVETLTELGEYRGTQYEPLLLFSTRYGFMLQIINDYADFAYSEDQEEQRLMQTAGKKTTDALADLFNCNITLPLIYHLNQKTRRNICAYLEGNNKQRRHLMDYRKQIMQEIIQGGAVMDCILRSMELAESAKTELDENNNQSAFFKDMCDIAYDNKFYHIFK